MFDLTILLASDDVLTQWGLTECMASAGMTVVGASRADRVTELLDDQPDFDVLLIDVDLPGSTGGLDVADQWRRALPGRPIVFTAAPTSSLVRPLRRGESFLATPLDEAALLEAIDQAISDALFDTTLPAAAESPLHHVH